MPGSNLASPLTESSSGLNAHQREAVEHGRGPLLVIAGAGTGKTTTIAHRVAHLVSTGTPPERILLLTFSRRAAAEMLSRARSLTRSDATGEVWGGTFHATAARLLRLHGRSIGLTPDFTVLDESDAADLLNLIRSARSEIYETRRLARKVTLADIYSRTVNTRRPLSEVIGRFFPWCGDEREAIATIFSEYTRRKRQSNLLDYDDLLLYWGALMDSASGERVAERFDHVLVDEYQDVNAQQAEILAALHRHIPSIFVVGDDAQAIYSFRSATVEHILSFPQRFPGTRVVTLDQNYRSTAPLLAVSNAVIALAERRHPKTLAASRAGGVKPELVTCRDELAQAVAVSRSVLQLREAGVPLVRQAVLFRTAYHSDVLEVELARHNIPFVKFGGLRFLEAAHVKDVVAILRVADNPRDSVSWFRMLQLAEGVGPVQAARIMAGVGVDNGTQTPTAVMRFAAGDYDAHEASRAALAGLRELLAALTNDEPAIPVASQIERIRRFCEPVFARLYRNADVRLRDIEQLEVIAAASTSRTAFLTDLALDPPDTTSNLAGPPHLDEDYLVLSTIHSAKGGEWDVVRVIHAADGMIPSDMATGDAETIDEERRLLYVALTRARDRLEVYFPMRYYRRPRGRGDAHGYAQLTRFIPDGIRHLFDEHSPEDTERADVEDAPSHHGENALNEFLETLWAG